MSILKIASALPLVVGIACSTSGTQSKDHTGAMSISSAQRAATPEASAQATPTSGSQEAAVVLAAGGSSEGSSSSGSSGSSGSSMGSSGSSGSGGAMGSGSSETPGGASGSSSGGAMGAGGSSESMGSAPEKGSSGGSASDTGSSTSGSSAMGSSGEAHGDEWVHGKVSKVSKDQITITPKSGETRTLNISDQTEVTINGKTAKASQLKKGQAVRASYSNENGQDVATKIMVGRARQARGHMKGTGGSSGTTGGGSSGSDTGSSGSESGGK